MAKRHNGRRLSGLDKANITYVYKDSKLIRFVCNQILERVVKRSNIRTCYFLAQIIITGTY